MHFPSPENLKLVSLINSLMLLYPLEADNITGYSLVLDFLFFIYRLLILGSITTVPLLSSNSPRVSMHCPSLVADCFPSFLLLCLTPPSSAVLYTMHSRLSLTPLFGSQPSPATCSLLPVLQQSSAVNLTAPFSASPMPPNENLSFPAVQFKIFMVILDFFFLSFHN